MTILDEQNSGIINPVSIIGHMCVFGAQQGVVVIVNLIAIAKRDCCHDPMNLLC